MRGCSAGWRWRGNQASRCSRACREHTMSPCVVKYFAAQSMCLVRAGLQAPEDQSEYGREAGGHEDRKFGRGEERYVLEGKVGDEDRHGEADTAQKSEQQHVTPANPCRQRADLKSCGQERGEHDAEGLAEDQARDD